jgi:thiol-disulfide isomerase/thioredoxin
MKLYIYLLVILWPAVYGYTQSSAQKIQPLSIGDTVPDILLPELYNYQAESARLSDFGNKIIILDFWATWCGSCVAAMPRMQELQDSFSSRLQVLMVNADPLDDRRKVEAFATGRKKRTGFSLTLPSVLKDTALQQLFPHTFIPHYIWLDKNRVVIAITGEEELNAVNIRKVVKGDKADFALKDDSRAYDANKTLQVEAGGLLNEDVSYRSVLTGFREGLGSAAGKTANEKGFITKWYAINTTLYSLFQMAWPSIFRFSFSRTVLQDIQLDLRKQYCYELRTSGLTEQEALQSLQQDLVRAFRIDIKNETRWLSCYVLKLRKGVKSIKTTDGDTVIETEQTITHKYIRNTSIPVFASWLQSLLKNQVVDETGLLQNIDLDIPAGIYGYNEAQLKKWLLQVGFDLLTDKRLFEAAVVSSL